MQRTKLLPVALPLLAALGLLQTAWTSRPHEWEGSGLSLEAGPLTLKLASGNLGGGKPQPEFQGGDWETNFSSFEKLLGAMVLATANGCPSDAGWEPATKYERYTKGKDNTHYEGCGDGYITFQNTKFKLWRTAEEILPNETLKKVVKELGGSVPEKAAKTLYGTGATLQKLFETELAKGKGFSGAEGCLKKRLAYPYFGEGFMQLAQWWKKEQASEAFVGWYLRDLRGTLNDMEVLNGLNPAVALPEKRENADATFCKVKGVGMRAQVFRGEGFEKEGKVVTATNKDGKEEPILLDWLSMALWDIFIVDAYVKWAAVKGNQFPALVTMTPDEEKEAILRVATHFVRDADIFFVQEVGGDLCAPGKFEQNAVAHCVPQVTTFDAAFFVNKGLTPKLSTVRDPDTDAVRKLYAKFLAAVVAGTDKPALATILQETHKNTTNMGAKGGVAEVSALGKVELAVAELSKGEAKVRALLVSAHPDSNGVNCALQLYLAKKVFEANWETGLWLEVLIMGSDTNLQTEEDYDDKLKKKENGYNEGLFRAKVKELGFDVLWPKDPTVHKQRTFLQTQLNKAGKHDQVRKDMVFVYPAGSISAPVPVPEATVYNVLGGDEGKLKPDYNGVVRYPTKKWPMDHCVTETEVTITPVGKPAKK